MIALLLGPKGASDERGRGRGHDPGTYQGQGTKEVLKLDFQFQLQLHRFVDRKISTNYHRVAKETLSDLEIRRHNTPDSELVKTDIIARTISGWVE